MVAVSNTNSAVRLALASLIGLGCHCEVDGFSLPSPMITNTAAPTTSLSRRSRVVMHIASYGRGAEIWPECNEDPLQLADSFPDGIIPPSAIMAMDRAAMDAVHKGVEEAVDDSGDKKSSTSKAATESRRQGLWSKRIARILRRAAVKEELDFEEYPAPMDRTPTVVALGLILRGLIRPLDVVVVSVMTLYFVILHLAARSPRDDEVGTPTLPALPPQGHVPIMVSNPMGQTFTYSKNYDAWLKLGVITGLFGPILFLTRLTLKKEMVAARVCARPIFLLCCQAISEAFSRRVMAPLPLRILVPVAYNTVRLAYLWNWVRFTFTTASSGTTHLFIGRTLAGVNLVYWTCNLLAFLLPIATIRYMRAHFFAVEAESVTTRKGMEETVGLIPH